MIEIEMFIPMAVLAALFCCLIKDMLCDRYASYQRLHQNDDLNALLRQAINKGE
jgi:IS30 family transposase